MSVNIKLFIKSGELAEGKVCESPQEILEAIGYYLGDGVHSVEVYIKKTEKKAEAERKV